MAAEDSLLKERGDWYLWRLCVTACSFFLFGVGGIILGYLIFPIVSLVSNSRKLSIKRCRYLIQQCFRLLVWFMSITGLLTREIHGEDVLSHPGQLIVANHPTLIDIVFLIAMTPNATCIVKSELYRNVFTRGPVSRAAYIANDSPHELIDECVQAIKNGSSLVIFPEGTRSVKGRVGPFKRGAAYVFLAAQCPLTTATIISEPPTLAKHDKWFKIPYYRPHFTVRIKEAKFGSIEHQPVGTPSARELTRLWRDKFIQEVEI